MSCATELLSTWGMEWALKGESLNASKAMDTAKLLEICASLGITKIAAAMSHESLPESQRFHFGPQSSVFSDDIRHDGWPAIWHACRQMGWSSCGNSNQYQVGEKLFPGVYHLVDGQWRKVA